MYLKQQGGVTMPLEIIRNDITKVHADAIVNAANSSLLGGGGVDGAIHSAAGPELLAECRTLGGCEVGQAKITKAYNLPARYVIHTVGPVWHDGNRNEEKRLADCYRNSLALAKDHNLVSIAFPLISSGAFGYPKDKALKTAISVIGDFLLNNDMTVFLVVYDKTAFILTEKLFSSIAQYIDDKYIEEQPFNRRPRPGEGEWIIEGYLEDLAPFVAETPVPIQHKHSLNDVMKQMDETFSQRLLRLIDEKGMTDAETYKKANIDRKLFSKIRNDINYRPSKPTAIALAISLRLNLDETRDLLLKAGFALSHSSKFDIIIQYFIEDSNYNIFEINEALFAFDQNLLGI
jgi:O-acetyl-ADP-ribose deacetylase (regulator of RNase III)/transcriptional regulator with XRE-family HTH domain